MGAHLPYSPEERKAAKKLARSRWVRNNKGRAAEISAAWKAANPDKMREQYLRRKSRQLEQNEVFRLKGYGLTRTDYARLLREQNGVCAICFRPSKIKLAVDHCHRTRRVRGLLCGPCNRGIGLLQDNPTILVAAARYLHEAAAAQLDEMLS